MATAITPRGRPSFETAVSSVASVLRHAGIDTVSPGQNSARQIVHFLESRLAQEIHRLGAAHAGAAMSDDFLAGIELVHTIRQFAERNQMSADVADVILVRLAHIENINVVAAIESLFQFFHFNFVGSHFGWGLLAANSTELLVIDQL